MTSKDRPRTVATANVAAIAEFLDGARIPFELVEHNPSMSAAAEAHVTHQPPDQVAKTVVLHDGTPCVIAAIPASERLDLQAARAARFHAASASRE
jgi:prolyl-tRNA editing enzyme YbaK/EbsC (Cys-tRNA(Pro) deacylase)